MQPALCGTLAGWTVACPWNAAAMRTGREDVRRADGCGTGGVAVLLKVLVGSSVSLRGVGAKSWSELAVGEGRTRARWEGLHEDILFGREAPGGSERLISLVPPSPILLSTNLNIPFLPGVGLLAILQSYPWRPSPFPLNNLLLTLIP